jgi:hypothetical protein
LRSNIPDGKWSVNAGELYKRKQLFMFRQQVLD